ncbi:ISL3 family transposase [Rhodopseudomonas sp. BR0C11]|uniref:ISL3 family transposase n=1 Tax=Rhodopseudomonas sp. BR0C11 TaxID=2269370 RepID=UPI0013E0E2DA|nr:ISL3 family transposase [Rhodopseudomonas sp. BR0C11]NEV75616.1 ISL3 family transposase [Rhodopseudomonas sp. BR0C11]
MINLLYLKDWTVLEAPIIDGEYVISAEFKDSVDTCAKCGAEGVYRHGRKDIAYRDAPVHGKPVVIKVSRQRFRCRHCSETFLQPLPDMDDTRRMTRRCVEYIEKQSLVRTYSSIAEDLNVSPKTVRMVSYDHLEALDAAYKPSAPLCLGMDEVTVMRSLRLILTDVAKKKVIDMVESRSKPSVVRWLSHLPDRERIQVVVTDMWVPYRDAVRDVLGVPLVVDKFHVVRYANDGLNNVRKEVGQEHDVKGRRMMMRSRHLLLKRPSKLKAHERLALDGWLQNVPKIKRAYDAKERFYSIYDKCTTKAEAMAAYDAWLRDLPAEMTKPFAELTRAMKNWRTEVFNYWDWPITNGYTEGKNRTVKMINRVGVGYSFPVLRARILFDPDNVVPAGSFICDECLGMYPVELKTRSRRTPKMMCPTCHRLHTDAWFKRHAVSTP